MHPAASPDIGAAGRDVHLQSCKKKKKKKINHTTLRDRRMYVSCRCVGYGSWKCCGCAVPQVPFVDVAARNNVTDEKRAHGTAKLLSFLRTNTRLRL